MPNIAHLVLDRKKAISIKPEVWIGLGAMILWMIATIYAFKTGTIVAYGDAESHLNIAKRVVDSITPGFAQLGGIWLPLPHLLLVPFVMNDFLWRTGLAGSLVSGGFYIVSSIFIYKMIWILTENRFASYIGAAVFMTNPNVLYLSATPMTEMSLIGFFALSGYYFIHYLKRPGKVLYLVAAAFFACCATLSRYDGWGLVLMEAALLFLFYIPWRSEKGAPAVAAPSPRAAYSRGWANLEGYLILFSTLAFFGIALWLAWGGLILGDPLYFTHSEFSAKSQQQNWHAAGELPAYKDLPLSFLYFAYTSLMNIGFIVTALALIGLALFVFQRGVKLRWYVLAIIFVPFIFNVATLYLGQSVIFIPGLTPGDYQWTLFNVRYGVMAIPLAAVFVGYLAYKFKGALGKGAVAAAIAAQAAVFALGYAPVITYADGTTGLSSAIAKVSDAQIWFSANYDHGMVLADDYSRVFSIIRSPTPMESTIYIGNKPYWDESMDEPEKYARWILMQEHDAIWESIYEDPVRRGRLFKYFNKVYTSDEVLIFKRME